MEPGVAITQLLSLWSKGDQAARDELARLAHQELHNLARAYLKRERLNHTLQPTALIHEVWLRLAKPSATIQCENRVHFFGIVAQEMRRVLVDSGRKHRAAKRGGGFEPLTLEGA